MTIKGQQALLTLNDAFGMVFVNLMFEFFKRSAQFLCRGYCKL